MYIGKLTCSYSYIQEVCLRRHTDRPPQEMMKPQEPTHVYLCVLMILIGSSNVFVSTAPQKLIFTDGVQTLLDDNHLYENDVSPEAEYFEDLYKLLRKERTKRFFSSAGPAGVGDQDLLNGVKMPANYFDQEKLFHDNSNKLNTLDDFGLRSNEGDVTGHEGFNDGEHNKASKYINIQPQMITDPDLNSIAMKRAFGYRQKYTDSVQSYDKRRHVICDTSKPTLNMLVEYLKNRTLCGRRATQVRFGLGK